jgi:NADP-dependent 3-hydroxy acid dehydrogenase YdfG
MVNKTLKLLSQLSMKYHFILGKHVVVTGGSSGIGLWAAIYAARKGADVTIVARKAKLLGGFYCCFLSH